jgi:preprotein translocase subunit YajC
MPTAVPAAPSNLEMLLPFVAIFVIFYFLIIRPQGKKMKQQDKFVGALKRGDDVITTGGILGTIDGLTDQIVTLEVASGVKIKMLKKQIASTQAAFFASAQKKDAVAAAATTKKS